MGDIIHLLKKNYFLKIKFVNHLVSGSSGGLGKYLAYKFKADIYNRKNKTTYDKEKNYKSIIHCAFGRPHSGEEELNYINTQLEVARDLLKYNHSKFIFISSIDTNANELSLYAKAKIAVEKLIKNSSDLYLIIKPGILFGSGMRINSIIKVALNKEQPLTLTGESNFYPVFYEDIEELISQDKQGIYTLVPKEKITLMDVAKEFKTKPLWGKYTYNSPIFEKDDKQFITKEMFRIKSIKRVKEFIINYGYKY